MDRNAWQYLYGPEQSEPEVFGVLKGKQERRKVYLDALQQLRQDAIPKPKPITLFGREWNASPTQLAERWTKHNIANEWMDLREELEGLQAYDQLRAVTERSIGGKLPPTMRGQLLKGSYGVYLRPWVQTGSLIIKLRKSKEATGAYPKDLSGLVPSDQKDRWIWESTPDGWRLFDKGLFSKPVGPVQGWLLP